jgi:hypothetical protein
MEPMLPEEQREGPRRPRHGFGGEVERPDRRLHPVLRAGVGDLVRSMNCCYSNLIEGHNTLPARLILAMIRHS